MCIWRYRTPDHFPGPLFPDNHQPVLQEKLRCNSAITLVFRPWKQRIPANRKQKRAFPQTIVSKTVETVSKVPEKQVIGA